MEVPWAQAVQIGVVGFSMVFLLLIMLGVVMWLTGLVLGKIGISEVEAADKKKGD